MAQKFLTNVELEAGLVDVSNSTGTSGYLLSSTGTATSWVDPAAVSVGESEQVHIACKNTSGVAISKGDPVYITGTVGTSFKIKIAKADAGDSAKMPAVGLAETDLANNAEGFVIVSGVLKNLTTDPLSTSDGTPSSNDTVYVKAGGGLTRTKPTGSGNLIQNVGKVGRVSSANAGSLAVSTIMRTNDVPNLTTGKIWVGSPTYTTESTVVHLDETNSRMGIGTSTPSTPFHVKGDAVDNQSLALLENNYSSGGVYFPAFKAVHTAANHSYGIVGEFRVQGTSSDRPSILFSNGHNNYTWQVGQGVYGANDNFAIGFRNFHPNTSGGWSTPRLTIDTAGNVGIGTTSPTRKFVVSNGGASGIEIQPNYVSGVNEILSFNRTPGATAYETMRFNGGDFQFQTSGSEKMRITSGGNVGIGTTNPGAKLEISHSGTNNGLLLENTNNVNNYQIALNIRENEGLIFQRWIADAFDGNLMRIGYTGAIKFDAYDSTNNTGTPTYLLGTDASGNIVKTNTVPGSAAGPYLPLAGGTMTGDLTVPKISTTNNGNGTNLKIGDDVWLGDINIANTFRISGVQDSTKGYITFGSSSNTALGRNGNGELTWGGNTIWHAGNDGAGSGLDADKLDGQSASDFVAVSGDTMTGSLDVNADIKANTFTQEATGIPRNNLGSPTITEMALFDSEFTPKTTLANNYNDLSDLEFYVQATSGSSWTLESVSDDNKRKFLRTNNSNIVIPNDSYKYRIEFNARYYTFANALYMYWSSQSHNTTVHIWKQRASDDAWIQHTNSTQVVSSWPGHLWLPFSTIPWLEDSASTSTGHYHKIRIEFEPTWSTGTYADRDIALYGGQIWGGYPSGRRTPHYYDQNGKLNTWGDFDVNGTAIIDGNVGIGVTSASQKLHVSGNARVTGAYYDSSNSAGTSGQVLSSTATGTDWISLNDIYYTETESDSRFVNVTGDTMTGDLLMDGKAGVGNVIGLATGTSSNAMSLKLYTYNNIDPGGGLGTSTGNMIQADLGSNLVLRQTANDGDITFQSDDGAGGIATYLTLDGSSTDAYFSNPGNVGIGTTSPLAPLHIVTPAVSGIDLNDISRTANNLVRFTNPQYSTNATMGLLLRVFPDSDSRQGAGLLMTGGSDNSSSNLSLFVSKDDGTSSNISQSYSALHIKGNTGNVGIGTTSPTSLLEISQQLSAAATIDYPYTISSRDDGNSINQVGGEGVGIKFRIAGNDATTPGNSLVGASIAAIRESSSDTDSSTGLGFFITQNDETLDEALRINHDGNVGIGTASPGYKLDVDGSAQFNTNTGTTPFYITRLGTTSQALSIKVMDDNVRFESIQDEAADNYGGFDFRMDGGVTEPDFVIRKNAGNPILNVKGNGNVGIGTTSPSDKLTVENGNIRLNTTNSSVSQGLFAHSNNSSPPMGGISWNQNPGFIGSEWYHYKQTSPYTQARIRLIGDASSGGMFVNLNGSDVFTIKTSSGNVGIGTTSPQRKLDIENGGFSMFAAGGTSADAFSVVTHNYIFSDENEDAVYSYDGTNGHEFSTNGSPRIRITQSGNVGIGTTSPNHELVVQGTSNPNIELKNSNYSNGGFILNRTNYGHQWKWWSESNVMYFGFSTDESTYSTKLAIESSGDVGIGTTSPQKKLHVSSGDQSTARIRLSNTNTASGGDNIELVAGVHNVTQDGFSIYNASGGGTQFVIQGGGNVGIGTNSPSEKLEVNGHIKAVDGYKGYVSYFHNGGFFHSPRSQDGANPMWIPINATGMSSSDQYYNTWVPLYAGRVRKIIIKHISGSTPVATVCTFRKKINGVLSSSTYAGTVTGGGAVGMKVTFDFGINNFTFNAEDEVQIGFVTGVATQPRMGGCSCQIWYEYNIT